MTKQEIVDILTEIQKGRMNVDDGLEKLRHLPYKDLGLARYDMHRPLRNGFSEVILCQGKNADQIIKIASTIAEKANIFGTRASAEIGMAVQNHFDGNQKVKAVYDNVSKTFTIKTRDVPPLQGRLGIISAGTADIPVAEEAAKTASFFGAEPKCFYDVGVAGIHRLVACLDDLKDLDCLIVTAGMEGALPSVVGGLLELPIVACPTSVGYGTNLNGIATLLAMLNSCSEGISVVNIDNGFGAACTAIRILRQIHAKQNQRPPR